ncbi:hypothetical protein KI387_042578 [Taxus chinensis]|uniref:Uncharacterized protein n=1 Tax=Taxus chinensis TaxID=29808 RepID=A0AA38C828_TAXCH|nr:hypothetical protein KI387_042578 [Taxus chinensis]
MVITRDRLRHADAVRGYQRHADEGPFMWERHSQIAELEGSMHRRDRREMAILLEAVGLGPVARMPSIVLDHGLLTALAE